MNFETALKRTAAEVDRACSTGFSPRHALAPLRVVEAMRYASIDRGKRIRPFFVTRERPHPRRPRRGGALRTGVALECVHCYSLFHDDLPCDGR